MGASGAMCLSDLSDDEMDETPALRIASPDLPIVSPELPTASPTLPISSPVPPLPLVARTDEVHGAATLLGWGGCPILSRPSPIKFPVHPVLPVPHLVPPHASSLTEPVNLGAITSPTKERDTLESTRSGSGEDSPNSEGAHQGEGISSGISKGDTGGTLVPETGCAQVAAVRLEYAQCKDVACVLLTHMRRQICLTDLDDASHANTHDAPQATTRDTSHATTPDTPHATPDTPHSTTPDTPHPTTHGAPLAVCLQLRALRVDVQANLERLDAVAGTKGELADVAGGVSDNAVQQVIAACMADLRAKKTLLEQIVQQISSHAF